MGLNDLLKFTGTVAAASTYLFSSKPLIENMGIGIQRGKRLL